MLSTLPLDFSFVDENDEVRYYSEGERIFPRSPGVIGRKVQNCHPPGAACDKVQEIVDAFRAGEKSAAEFWIQARRQLLPHSLLRGARCGRRVSGDHWRPCKT